MRLPVLLLLAALAAAADPWERLAEAARLPPAEARAALEQLLTEAPGFAAARFNLGTLLLGSDAGKAAEQLELATAATAPEIAADAWHNLALARFAQGRLEDALRAAEQAVRLDPAAVPLRDEIRRVALVRQDEARRKAEEEARKLHLAPTPLPPAHVGEPYRAQLPIVGGTPPYTATLAGKSKLPEGLTLSAAGGLGGTPRQAGASTLDLALQDQAGGKATGSVTLTVLPAPAITTTALPEAVVGLPYAAKLEAVGLAAPLRWSGFPLPAGLTLAADGTLGGTPTAGGTSNLNLHVEDGTRSADRLLELKVVDGFVPAENPLPPATASAAYRHRATVRGPAQEYRWSAAAGGPLAIAADGTVSGTPPQPGELRLGATIAAGDGRRSACELVVPVNPLPLIQPEPVQLQVGRPADQALKVEGGTAPFTWSVAGGALPAGMRLDADGHLRGVPKDAGTSTVTVALSDRWQAGTQADIAITVKPSDDPPPQDQQKQDQQQQDQQDGKDQQQAGKDQQQQQNGKDQQQQQQQAGKDQQQQEREREQAAQAAQLNQTAAEGWLDHLPEENREVLRYQLLDGGQKKPRQKGKAW